MSLIRQFNEELSIYFQCCISAPYLTNYLVFFSRTIIRTVRSVARELSIYNIDINILHMTLYNVYN